MKKLFIMFTVILAAEVIFAEGMSCENENGSCEFEEDGSFVCSCSDDVLGDGGVAGSPVSDEDYELPDEEECLEILDSFCGVPEGAEDCENPAGECIVYDDGNWDCYCEDGRWEDSWESEGESEPGNPGDGETEPYPGEDEDDEIPDHDYICEENSDCPPNYICEEGFCEFDDENFEPPVCMEVLENVCGTEAPDINDICSDESFGYCTDVFSVYVEKCEDSEIPESMIDELENGKWNDLGSEIAECCREYKEIKPYTDELVECLETKSCEECLENFEEQIEEDYDDRPSENDEKTDPDEDNSSTGTDKEESESLEDDASSSDESEKSSTSSGCSVFKI
ncbi:MAG: hypothetical protein R6W70_03095 [bacterium]